MCSVICFFQAEDGIRDLVRSRGLGDVYKRQAFVEHELMANFGVRIGYVWRGQRDQYARINAALPVSYTHLTLPTSDLV